MLLSTSSRFPFDEDLGAGLSAAQVRSQLALDGPNEWPGPKPLRGVDHLLAQWREPMIRLLLGASVVYALLGDVREALALLGFVLVSAGISVWQSSRTEAVLVALRRLSATRAWVLRDARAQRIAASDLVVGDLIALSEGDRVAADAQVLRAADLLVDESLLTGESVPVHKWAASGSASAAPLKTASVAALADDHVYAGSRVLAGQGIARVVKTGHHTEVGRIGVLVEETDLRDTPTQRQMRRWVRALAVWGAVLSLALTLLWVALRGGWLEGTLAGISLAMSLLPQELPLVLTVFFAMGSWRLAAQKVLVRRASAIEALGAATVLMTDKTGTLTRNEMRLVALELSPDASATSTGAATLSPNLGPPRWQPAWEPWPVDQHAVAWEALLTVAALACESPARDPMEAAVHALADAHGVRLPLLAQPRQLVHEFGLTPDLPAMSHVWQGLEGSETLWVTTKGAPEAVAALCGPSLAPQALACARQLASQGMRVLAVARARVESAPTPWPPSAQAFTHVWLGVLAWADPLREGVSEAVAECQTAGVRVVMVTGDHPATAWAIARQAGVVAGEDEAASGVKPPAVITGAELQHWSDERLQRGLGGCRVFARITPAQKLRLVACAQRMGDVVAMTGDGVNDAPSLKAADIGIAMGERGTDVAREVSALILQDDAFPSIVAALRLGRLIRTNLRHAMLYLLAAHVPIAVLCLVPVLLGWPVLLMPMHIMFLEVLIAPLCSIAFEADPAPPNLMHQAPRPVDEPLLGRSGLALCVLQGVWVGAWVLALFGGLLGQGWAEAAARGTAFSALVLSSLALVWVNRRWAPGRWVNWRMMGIGLCAMLALLLIFSWPDLRTFFRVQPPGFDGALLAGLVMLLVAVWPRKKDPPPLQEVGRSS